MIKRVLSILLISLLCFTCKTQDTKSMYVFYKSNIENINLLNNELLNYNNLYLSSNNEIIQDCFSKMDRLFLIQLKTMKFENSYKLNALQERLLKELDIYEYRNIFYKYYKYAAEKRTLFLINNISEEHFVLLHNILTYINKHSFFIYSKGYYSCNYTDVKANIDELSAVMYNSNLLYMDYFKDLNYFVPINSMENSSVIKDYHLSYGYTKKRVADTIVNKLFLNYKIRTICLEYKITIDRDKYTFVKLHFIL